MTLNKVGQERDGLRDFNSLLQHCMNDLKAAMSALKETLLFCSQGAEFAEKNTQNFML